MTPITLHRTLIASALLAALDPASGQQVADAANPARLVTRADIESSGRAEPGQVLQALDAGFNYPTTFLSGGTDILRPATLAGLGPDQLLVLVNGKRRHQGALVNVQQTVGRGAAGTDLDAIPLSAIDHIEVLHGEAAAAYGSDAIAGVINVVLKRGAGEGRLAAMAGATAQGDGKLVSASASRGFALGASGGYLDLSLEGRRRGATERAGAGQSPDAQRVGDIATRGAWLWANAALPIGQGGELYAFGGASKRSGDGYAPYRPKDDPRNVPAAYPDGYVPGLAMSVRDASLAAGYRHTLSPDWKFDLSVIHGRNEIGFGNRNSVNVSYWYDPNCELVTEADAGKLVFTQTTVNAGIKGPLTLLGSRIDITAGAEYRRDRYQIAAGAPASYQYGHANNPALWIGDQTGRMAAPGMQGFPGYSPADAIDGARHNAAFYLDMQQQIAAHLVMGSAMRRERYSDIGDVAAGNVSLRYDPVPALGLRASASSGFRAPSVHQRFYSSTVTDLDGAGAMTQTITVREGSMVARALAIEPLRPELSRTAGFAIVLRPAADFSLTANAWRTRIYHRIVLSSPVGPQAGYPVAAVLGPLGADQVQLFTNAIDTVTKGLDLVAEHTLRRDGKTLALSAQLGFNRTTVAARYSTSPIISGERLFDDTQVMLVERGQPRQHHVIKADLATGPWRFGARANYYGAVQGQGYTAPAVQVWEPKWLLDLSLGRAITRRLGLSAGVNNLFDRYPGTPGAQAGFANCRESCPFGINGRTLYARVDYRF